MLPTQERPCQCPLGFYCADCSTEDNVLCYEEINVSRNNPSHRIEYQGVTLDSSHVECVYIVNAPENETGNISVKAYNTQDFICWHTRVLISDYSKEKLPQAACGVFYDNSHFSTNQKRVKIVFRTSREESLELLDIEVKFETNEIQ